jgi:hypothetical protein
MYIRSASFLVHVYSFFLLKGSRARQEAGPFDLTTNSSALTSQKNIVLGSPATRLEASRPLG